MAVRPTLEIDDVPYKNVYEVSYKLYTAKDETGKPTDRAHAGTVRIKRESDESTEIARWAMDSSKPNWKKGKVIFRKTDMAELKVLTWENGFVTFYEEHVPNVKDRPDEQMWEEFEVSCEKLTIKDADIDNRWEE